MSAPWSRLLQDLEQPSSLRECYDLVAQFVENLRTATPLVAIELDYRSGARAGYLVAASRMMAGVSLHPTWAALEFQLRAVPSQLPKFPFLVVDAVENSRDELAQSWGLSRGVDAAKLSQIAKTGVC